MLIGVLLFNWCGYRLWLSYLETKANHELEQSVDDERYDPSDLLTIRVPIPTVAYNVHSAPFERMSGQILIRGVSYNFVGRRMHNDSLELICIANPAVTHLLAMDRDCCKLFNSSKFIPDDLYLLQETFRLPHFERNRSEIVSLGCGGLPLAARMSPEQPPDLLSRSFQHIIFS